MTDPSTPTEPRGWDAGPSLSDEDLQALDRVEDAPAHAADAAWKDLPEEVRRHDDALARDILGFINDIGRFTQLGPQAFFESTGSMSYLATQMRLINMAYAVEEMTPAYRAIVALAQIRQLIGMRHRLAHAYAHVSQEIVWTTATTDLQALRERLEWVIRVHPPTGG